MTTVTTAGSSGAPQGPEDGAPQEDDPFGYLYRPADGGSGQPAEPQQGVPRTPYSRPMEVGRAQYGQPPRPQQPYPPQQQGYPQAQPQQPYPQQQYPPQGEFAAAPTQQTGRYAEHSRPQPGEERPSGGSGRGKGAVIGAVAVVAAVAIGAGIALSGDPDKDGDKDAKGGGSSASAPATPGATTASTPAASASATPSATAAGGLGTVDANQLQGQNAPSGNTVKGARSADGGYLTLGPGGTVTWTGDLAAAGTYKFTVHYNNPGADVRATMAVNGKDWPGGSNFKNYSPGKDPAGSWFNTYITPPMVAGTNTIVISLPAGSGAILIDQVQLEATAG
ncbi:carbohydrate-binding protein [Kitasatospora sp. NPDC056327]|uniref:carbohydrate-binding protein n=1 Tax=Kitasatospora sp. NPDC056327 TaxID=3345785 RepID=UPI0035E06EED